MTFTFSIVSRFMNRSRSVRVRMSTESIVVGDLDMTTREWDAFKRLLGSGAVEAANVGIICKIEEE